MQEIYLHFLPKKDCSKNEPIFQNKFQSRSKKLAALVFLKLSWNFFNTRLC